MGLKVIATGQGDVVVLPQHVLDELGLAAGESVTVAYDASSRQLTVAAERGVDAAFVAQLDEFVRQYRPALQILAND